MFSFLYGTLTIRTKKHPPTVHGNEGHSLTNRGGEARGAPKYYPGKGVRYYQEPNQLSDQQLLTTPPTYTEDLQPTYTPGCLACCERCDAPRVAPHTAQRVPPRAAAQPTNAPFDPAVPTQSHHSTMAPKTPQKGGGNELSPEQMEEIKEAFNVSTHAAEQQRATRARARILPCFWTFNVFDRTAASSHRRCAQARTHSQVCCTLASVRSLASLASHPYARVSSSRRSHSRSSTWTPLAASTTVSSKRP